MFFKSLSSHTFLSIKLNSSLFFGLIMQVFLGCSEDQNSKREIVIIQEKSLVSLLNSEIERYKLDLENEGYKVVVKGNVDSTTSPDEIRRILQEKYEENENLEGAVFIGNIKSPLFNERKRQGDPYWHDYLCDFYYMDLDGFWEDTDNNGVFDNHKNSENKIINWVTTKFSLSNNRTPEIWVSRITAEKLYSLGDRTSLLKEYFNKNHLYRTGELTKPAKRAFIVSDGVDVLKSDWGAWPGKIYSSVDVVQCQDNPSDSLKKFLSSEQGYEWGVVSVFSGPRFHHFDEQKDNFNPEWWNSKEGRSNITLYSDSVHDPTDISLIDLKNIKPNVLFYHLHCSETGRFNYPDYLAGAYIFSGLGLTAVAGTQHSGSVGDPVFYESLAEGETIGQAWKNSLISIVNTTGEKLDVYFCDHKEVWTKGSSTYKAVLIGDGTLKLPKRN